MHAVLRGMLAAAAGLALAGSAAQAQKDKPADPKWSGNEVGNSEFRMTEEWGYERPEKTIREFITGDLDECKRQCLRSQSCLAYVYKTGSGSCRLKYEIVAKKPDRKSVTGIKVRRGGRDDRDDFGNWGQARQACRERVARETNAGQGSIALDFDEDTGNTARFQWHAGSRRGSCTATQGGRVTDFNTRAGSTKQAPAAKPATTDQPAPAAKGEPATASQSKDKQGKNKKSKEQPATEPATDGSATAKQTK